MSGVRGDVRIERKMANTGPETKLLAMKASSDNSRQWCRIVAALFKECVFWGVGEGVEVIVF